MGGDPLFPIPDQAQSRTATRPRRARSSRINTGDFCGMGKNELLVGKALKDRRDRALVSVKFGALER